MGLLVHITLVAGCNFPCPVSSEEQRDLTQTQGSSSHWAQSSTECLANIFTVYRKNASRVFKNVFTFTVSIANIFLAYLKIYFPSFIIYLITVENVHIYRYRNIFLQN